MSNFILLIVSCSLTVVTCNCYEFISQPRSVHSNIDVHYLEGKKRYSDFSQKVPTYGDCWKSAISELHIGCQQLTENVQSHLALSFANCFLQNTGSQTCPCLREQPISDCLKHANERIFSTFREFYTHTQSICYFLEHQAWQEQTGDIISTLTSTSQKVSAQLEESKKFQNSILQLQRIAVKKQHQMINFSEVGLTKLNQDLENSRRHVQNVFEEFKSTTDEQRMLIFSVFDHVKKLENLVVGEFSGVYTFIYYFITIILSYMLTSTPRTADARIWLLLLMTFSALLERIITASGVEDETLKGLIYHRIWLCRKVMSIFGCVLLVAYFYLYKDYNAINNQLLLEIQKQNKDMQNFIKAISLTPNGSSLKRSDEISLVEEKKRVVQKEIDKSGRLDCFAREVLKFSNANTSLPLQDAKVKKQVKQYSRKSVGNLKAKDDKENSCQDNIETRENSFGRYNLRDRSAISPRSYTSASPEALSHTTTKAARMSFVNGNALKKMKQFT